MKSEPVAVKGLNQSTVDAARLVGRPWTLLIVAVLGTGPHRFGELTRALKGISTNLLTERLRELEMSEVVERSETKGVIVYDLTARGSTLLSVVAALDAWAARR